MCRRLVAVAIVLTLGMTACKGQQTTSERVSDSTRSAGQAAGNAANTTGTAVGGAARTTGNAVGDAAKATGNYVAPSKDAAVKAAQDTVNTLEKKWRDLEAKAAPTTDEAKADFQKTKDQMAKSLDYAKVKLVEAKDASDDAWQQNVKPALDATLDKAQKLYDDAAAKFGSK